MCALFTFLFPLFPGLFIDFQGETQITLVSSQSIMRDLSYIVGFKMNNVQFLTWIMKLDDKS
jgi:hypothetical protein